MALHIIGVAGLAVVFLVGTVRPINLGVLALVMTFLVGTVLADEPVRQMYTGFPVDLFLLLVGVTYLFGVATSNGTVRWIVDAATRLFGDRRALIPWAMFVVASLPAMAGALGSAGVAMLAPLALRLAKRYEIDRRLIGLMVIYGAGAGNFSPLNVLGAIVAQAAARDGVDLSVATLFFGNLAANVLVAGVAYVVFGGLALGRRRAGPDREAVTRPGPETAAGPTREAGRVDRVCTLIALTAVAVAALGFGLSIGFLALVVAVSLQVLFPQSSGKPEKHVAWGVVLLVCGIITYVAALQRYGTIQVVGDGIAALRSPLLSALLLCAVGGVTSAFASSAGILGAMIPLAAPFMLAGSVDTTGMIVALAVSATLVDAMPFSTVGALVVANAEDEERPRVYRGLLYWGTAMILAAPPFAWLVFVVAAGS